MAWNEAWSEVIEITTLNAIRNLMETLKLTAEQAMEALKVPKKEKVKYVGMLKW